MIGEPSAPAEEDATDLDELVNIQANKEQAQELLKELHDLN